MKYTKEQKKILKESNGVRFSRAGSHVKKPLTENDLQDPTYIYLPSKMNKDER